MNQRILHVINGESYAGAERVQDLLALRLPDFGYEVVFACLKPRDFPLRRQSTAELHRLSMAGRFDLRAAGALASLARSARCVLLHTHTPRAVLAGRMAAGRTGLPFVHHVHSPTARDTESAWRNRVNAAVEDFCMARASRLVPVSASLRTYLAERGRVPPQVQQVDNGVPTPCALPVRDAPRGAWVIGCVALFRPRKGVEVLIDAVADLLRRGQRLRLRLVGPFETPGYEAAVRAHADAQGASAHIDWCGFCADVQAELARMDAFVLPSLYGEGMPMVLLEAMAAGIPVLASAVEGIPEVLDQGRCGLLVPAGDAQALASRLGELMAGRSDWQGLRARAHERQVQKYSDVAMARSVAAVYDAVLA